VVVQLIFFRSDFWCCLLSFLFIGFFLLKFLKRLEEEDV